MLEQLRSWWKASSVEWREKIEWPTLPQLFSTTVAVLVGSLLIALVIGTIDLIFSTIMRFLYSLF
jgi:preprotein translocase SecE subunit